MVKKPLLSFLFILVFFFSHDRYIYLHGTRNELNIGKAKSAGCIHLRNEDVIELFDRVAEGTYVYIDGRQGIYTFEKNDL